MSVKRDRETLINEDTIILTSSDSVEISVNKQKALMFSATLRYLSEDSDVSQVPVPNIDITTLKIIVEMIERYDQFVNGQLKEIQKDMTAYMSLLLAMNYLDIDTKDQKGLSDKRFWKPFSKTYRYPVNDWTFYDHLSCFRNDVRTQLHIPKLINGNTILNTMSFFNDVGRVLIDFEAYEIPEEPFKQEGKLSILDLPYELWQKFLIPTFLGEDDKFDKILFWLACLHWKSWVNVRRYIVHYLHKQYATKVKSINDGELFNIGMNMTILGLYRTCNKNVVADVLVLTPKDFQNVQKSDCGTFYNSGSAMIAAFLKHGSVVGIEEARIRRQKRSEKAQEARKRKKKEKEDYRKRQVAAWVAVLKEKGYKESSLDFIPTAYDIDPVEITINNSKVVSLLEYLAKQVRNAILNGQYNAAAAIILDSQEFKRLINLYIPD